jgi:hypothetical protein
MSRRRQAKSEDDGCAVLSEWLGQDMREVVIKWEIFSLAFTVEIKENYCGLEKRAMAVQNY